MSAYNVSKAAVVALSETLYAEYKSTGIRVSVACPTFFRTQIVEAGRGAATQRENARIIRWMERSKVQAPGVAKTAIDSLQDGKLYVLPMQDGEVAWRMKREAPEMFYDSQSEAHEKYLEGRYKP